MQLNPHNPNLLQVASQAQRMAQSAQQDKMAFAFQSVAMVSMALMGVTAAAQFLRELLRSETPGRGR